MPGCGRRVSDPFDRRPPAFLELPKDQIVFKAVRPDRQVVAVGLEIEQDAGALIDATRQAFEADADFPVLEVFDILSHDIRIIGISLNAIEKFRVTIAIERTRLVGDAGRGLSLLPLPAINGQQLLAAVIFDAPHADHRDQPVWLGACRFIGQVHLDRRRKRRQEHRNHTHGYDQ